MKNLLELVDYDERETKIYMPNEIFSHLSKLVNVYRNEKRKNPFLFDTDDYKRNDNLWLRGAVHAAYAYSYTYIVNYAWSYRKHWNTFKFTSPNIKQMLGISRSNSEFDYITKVAGVLDKIHYTEATTDIPVRVEMTEFGQKEFITISQYKKENEAFRQMGIKNTIRYKFPVTAFYRSEETFKNRKSYDGTFYHVENTHSIDIKDFFLMLENENIGIQGVYLYAFLKKVAVLGCANPTFQTLHEELLFAITTLEQLINSLEKEGFIKVKRGANINKFVKTPNEYSFPKRKAKV